MYHCKPLETWVGPSRSTSLRLKRSRGPVAGVPALLARSRCGSACLPQSLNALCPCPGAGRGLHETTAGSCHTLGGHLSSCTRQTCCRCTAVACPVVAVHLPFAHLAVVPAVAAIAAGAGVFSASTVDCGCHGACADGSDDAHAVANSTRPAALRQAQAVSSHPHLLQSTCSSGRNSSTFGDKPAGTTSKIQWLNMTTYC